MQVVAAGAGGADARGGAGPGSTPVGGPRGAQLLFRFIAAAYERRALGIASHWPFESWGRFLPEHTTAVSLLDRLLHHANGVATDGESYRMREARTQQGGATHKR
jgi:DNA replication protein DnaC